METVTIIPSDNAVYINGEMRPVDCSTIDKTIHAVQWCHCPKRKLSKGHIEWVQDPFMPRKRNTEIADIEQFQGLIDVWHQTDDEQTRHAKEFAALREKELADEA